MSDTKKPVARVNLHPVSVAIWANRTEKGTRYSVTIASRYKDAGGKWKNSVSLSENELLLAAKALDLAHTEIIKLRAADHAAEQADDEAA
jgi:hypothetical protein